MSNLYKRDKPFEYGWEDDEGFKRPLPPKQRPQPTRKMSKFIEVSPAGVSPKRAPQSEWTSTSRLRGVGDGDSRQGSWWKKPTPSDAALREHNRNGGKTEIEEEGSERGNMAGSRWDTGEYRKRRSRHRPDGRSGKRARHRSPDNRHHDTPLSSSDSDEPGPPADADARNPESRFVDAYGQRSMQLVRQFAEQWQSLRGPGTLDQLAAVVSEMAGERTRVARYDSRRGFEPGRPGPAPRAQAELPVLVLTPLHVQVRPAPVPVVPRRAAGELIDRTREYPGKNVGQFRRAPPGVLEDDVVQYKFVVDEETAEMAWLLSPSDLQSVAAFVQSKVREKLRRMDAEAERSRSRHLPEYPARVGRRVEHQRQRPGCRLDVPMGPSVDNGRRYSVPGEASGRGNIPSSATSRPVGPRLTSIGTETSEWDPPSVDRQRASRPRQLLSRSGVVNLRGLTPDHRRGPELQPTHPPVAFHQASGDSSDVEIVEVKDKVAARDLQPYPSRDQTPPPLSPDQDLDHDLPLPPPPDHEDEEDMLLDQDQDLPLPPPPDQENEQDLQLDHDEDLPLPPPDHEHDQDALQDHEHEQDPLPQHEQDPLPQHEQDPPPDHEHEEDLPLDHQHEEDTPPDHDHLRTSTGSLSPAVVPNPDPSNQPKPGPPLATEDNSVPSSSGLSPRSSDPPQKLDLPQPSSDDTRVPSKTSGRKKPCRRQSVSSDSDTESNYSTSSDYPSALFATYSERFEEKTPAVRPPQLDKIAARNRQLVKGRMDKLFKHVGRAAKLVKPEVQQLFARNPKLSRNRGENHVDRFVRTYERTRNQDDDEDTSWMMRNPDDSDLESVTSISAGTYFMNSMSMSSDESLDDL